ncbi:tRNA (adenosine(37)-N6)-dimethylallyltransferase MiaA [Opitutales bacterium]|jgi:tRNA dimethylallyltransferase|nr:tRNA (adenosine(37)-N6)-dimethylallyltransferase MiaA [Opitutales bacterium]
MEEAPRIYFVAGVTAVGKTAFSLDWAEREGAEVLSCDALLFYRGMNLGTAKPTKLERDRVPHHGIDLCEPSDSFDIARYVDYAKSKVKEIHERGRPVLIVGGSGFYLKGFFEPVSDGLVIPDAIREKVELLEREEGLNGLLHQLREHSPGDLGNLDLMNPRRVARALERCLASGESVTVLQQRFLEVPNPFDRYVRRSCLLERESSDLEKRIRLRAAAILNAGLVEETEHLLEHGLEENPTACRAVGYREVLAMLAGNLPKDQLLETIVRSTLQLAAKQRKWFRNQFHPDVRLVASAGESFSINDFPLAP